MDRQVMEKLGTKIGEPLHSYPGLASVAHKLSDLSSEVADLERQAYALRQIRATLLLNFGAGSSNNQYGVGVTEDLSTEQMLMTVLQHLVQFTPKTFGSTLKQEEKK